MRSEVLESIKKTEEEYRAMISQARAERERGLAGARLEADTLVMKAKADTEEYKKKRLESAREEAARKRKTIIQKGEEQAAALRARGQKNLDKAVDLLIQRFREQVHVSA